MKIFKSIFVALFCVLTFSFGLTACGEENIKVNFKKETNQIVMGESYDPFHFLNYDEQDKSKIYFVSGDENVFFITPDNRLVAQNTGKGVLYAGKFSVSTVLRIVSIFSLNSFMSNILVLR